MEKSKDVSMSTIRRLPQYYRYLEELRKNGVVRISSKSISEATGFTASQIRQDLNFFGDYGLKGYGYNVEYLCGEMTTILGISTPQKCILIGAGHLGTAIIGHIPFSKLGFSLVGIFDTSPDVIGKKIYGHIVRNWKNIESFYLQYKPDMAIIAVPKDYTESVADRLFPLGIKTFWNFGHYDISRKYPEAIVENVRLNDSLLVLGYRMK